ncbi:MAG: monovalent cation/H+ antiporter subunit A [Rhodobacterales bacterium]|nr:monovalent cation/H+ antiporter subunit A [Rhodobacterales bacterium]
MTLPLIVALPFLGALLPGLMIRAGRTPCALTTAAFTALALLGLILHAPAVIAGQVITARIEWLPQLGLAASFRLDGLGLLFAGLILGIGLLIILYARFYLSSRDPMGVFYSYLMLFQGAMVGIVLSDNILLLLVFWELTSLSSFLLIGYWKHLPEGRQGARMALAITGGGGLAMIAGMLMLGQIAGSYELSVILEHRVEIQSSPLYAPALVLMLLGCFTKSAQFPFHFWLPHAMAAPTPVSAYLHSATMVKAGIFLMARLWPVLSGTAEWFWIVTSAGLITMLVGAAVALFKDDLKAILAYSTVSHLGLVTMLLGMGTNDAAVTAVFHIINHATFKAALFMAAGIVDHEVGTRDIRRLGGLARLMPVTFGLTTVAGLSMAGIPPLNGFISKEMMLEAAVHTHWLGGPWTLAALATLGALLSVAYSFRLVGRTFLGAERHDYPHHPHDPPEGMWAAPALLVGLVVAIGLAPMAMTGWIVTAAADAVTGQSLHPHLKLWHGLKPALVLSILAVAGGALLFAAHGGAARAWAALPRLEGKAIFDRTTAALAAAARRLAEGSHDGALTRYMAIATVAMVAAGVWAFATGDHAAGTRAGTPIQPVALAGWTLLMVCTAATVVAHRLRILAVLLVGVVGLMVSVAFAYLAAPDLALTQISVEVVTVVLMLLALNFLPRTTPRESSVPRRLRDGGVAVAAGLAVGALTLAMLMRDFALPSVADYYLANSKTEGGGTNVVNVILVDFRGYDTFGEITVLGIGGLLIYALTETILRGGPANDRLLSWPRDRERAGDRHPMMLVVATRLILPIALMVGVFIFLRGHNLPGGGFIAGLIVSIALVMQYAASGFGWTQARQRIDYHAMIGVGVLVAAGTGVGAWFNGLPFLTSAYGYVDPPVVEEFELATAALFDLGVFLTVTGAVMLTLSSLSRVAVRAGETVATRPYDTDPRATQTGGH